MNNLKKINPIIIGISGPSGSGKSILCSTIIKELGPKNIELIGEDSYYKNFIHLSFEERCKKNFDHPEAFDHALLIMHLEKVKNNEEIEVPIYNYVTHLREKKYRKIKKCKILLVEGILLFTDTTLRNFMDIKIFIDTPLDLCLIRKIHRDITHRGRTLEFVLSQYTSYVRPMFVQFIEPSKEHADLIIPQGGQNRIAIDIIKAKIQELLKKMKD